LFVGTRVCLTTRQTGGLTVGRNITFDLVLDSSICWTRTGVFKMAWLLCGSGLKCLHRSPASRKSRQKENPVISNKADVVMSSAKLGRKSDSEFYK
jgi:hypothetical protein